MVFHICVELYCIECVRVFIRPNCDVIEQLMVYHIGNIHRYLVKRFRVRIDGN